MKPEEETAYWDHIARDSRRIEAELWSDLNTSQCLDLIAPYLPAAGLVLDLGCGVGRLTIPLAEDYPRLRLVGLDSSPLMIEVAQLQSNQVAWMVGNGRTLEPLTSDSYDGAYSMTTFQHIPPEAQQGYLLEVHRILKPGGVFRLQWVTEAEAAPLSYPTPVKDMLAWADKAGLRDTGLQLGLLHAEWAWATFTK